MPQFDPSPFNIAITSLGSFIILYGLISTKIKQAWYLGEALPAVIVGIILAFILPQTSLNDENQTDQAKPPTTTLNTMHIIIGIQLVITGYNLPPKYLLHHLPQLSLCLLPIMTTMWLCTALCVLLICPHLSILSCLVIASCVACTDPILSQAIACGPFADRFVARSLRELISCEAGANDGFGFPFLMLAVYLLRHGSAGDGHRHVLLTNGFERVGGGFGVVMRNWLLETWLYTVILSVIYGALVGFISRKLLRFCLKRKWIDNKSYALLPTALGLFIIGTMNTIASDDLLACFIAGNALNWDSHYQEEMHLRRRDLVNPSIDTLLNLAGFMYIGTLIPWAQFSDSSNSTTSGLTYPRLLALGVLVLIFRRIPVLLATYRFMPSVVRNWREALFMGYFGPIGAGAVFYLEYARQIFANSNHPQSSSSSDDEEIVDLTRAMVPIVYWLVLFSIVVHGLSIPALRLYYWYVEVCSLEDDDDDQKSARQSRRQSIVADEEEGLMTPQGDSEGLAPMSGYGTLPRFERAVEW